MEIFIRIRLIILLLTAMLFSCANDMDVINRLIDTELEPDLLAENVELMYSDSARLTMRMVSPIVKQFNSATEKRDEFPEGLHVWLYEKTGELKAEITANWARHDTDKNLWEARSNVVVTNNEGLKLETEQLFWNPPKGIVYSEKYTKITAEDGTIATGNKFNAIQDFTEWRLTEGKATIILKDEKNDEE